MSIIPFKTKKAFLFSALENCEYGSLNLRSPNGERLFFKGNKSGAEADIYIKDWTFLNHSLTHGDIGFAETYMNGLWDTTDLPALLIYFAQNLNAIGNLANGKKIFQLFLSLTKIKNINSKRGSKKNIYKHYDLGNDFYQLWLDPSMTYSSAIFNNEQKELEKAQSDKYNRILNQIPKHANNLLEIGCGWGGFSQIAGQSQLKVDAITISKAQHDYALNRMKSTGLSNNVDIRIQDYRDVQNKYDAIVSIEMFEAVGREYWANYFKVLKDSLAKTGRAIVQTITIDDSIFDAYIKRTDFIQKHIFPGGLLPSKSTFNSLAQKFGLCVVDQYAFGQCYANTLSQWLKNFDDVYTNVRSLGFDDVFIRKWRFYLAYCIAGFRIDRTDVVQFTLQHSDENVCN